MAKLQCAAEKVHALITGPPGVGKTTLVRAVCQKLQEDVGPNLYLHGFYTEEIREGGTRGRGPRTGFDVVTIDGQRGVLARIADGAKDGSSRQRRPTVGRYSVYLESFEEVALPTLQTITKSDEDINITICPGDEGHHLYVIDEIGKMELFSRNFVDRVRILFNTPRDYRPHVVMATIPVARQKSHWLVEELRKRGDCVIFEVTEKNRETLVAEVTDFIKTRLDQIIAKHSITS